MGQNQFIESLVEVMLSWMRWLTGWFWNIVNSRGGSGGFFRWLADHWAAVALVLIVGGAVLDWLIWMIRWRPYWLWLRKRQIIYEEVPARRRRRRTVPAPAADGFEDPFAAPAEGDPYAAEEQSRAVQSGEDVARWDIEDDPYARQPETHTDYDPSYARPTLGENGKKVILRHSRPILGERKKRENVDDGQPD